MHARSLLDQHVPESLLWRYCTLHNADRMLRPALTIAWLAGLHVVGLLLFCRGFLLSRTVLDDVSARTGSEPAARFQKAVVLVIDALRYDFVYPQENSTLPYHNRFLALHEAAERHPDRAFLTPFIADPPTTTLQRLKGLTTGSLPTFIDAGSNFAGTEILEDNWVSQLRAAGKRLAFVGDDTWQSLFPSAFEPALNRPFESFNVWDLDTVDRGVERYLFDWLSGPKQDDWDVLIAHALGVDHAGHRYGPNHHETARKLGEMDDWAKRLMDLIDGRDDTLLVVMGDHGMNAQGDHGGDSELELWASLWMYASRAGVFGASTKQEVRQIDLVPTLSLLLGSPIPFNNLGSPVEQCFPRDYAQAVAATTSQIRTYADAYRTQSDEIGQALDQVTGEDEAYHRAVLDVFAKRWAQYDLYYIALGLLVFVVAMLSNITAIYGSPVPLGQLIVLASTAATAFDLAPVLTVAAASLQALVELCRARRSIRISPWVLLGLAHCAIFGSNSFIIFEDRVSLLLVNTSTVALAALALHRGRPRAALCLVLVAALGRAASTVRLCREEQGGKCISNFYSAEGSGSSSTGAALLLAVCAALLPWASSVVAWTMDVWHGRSAGLVKYYLPTAMAASALYWRLDALDTLPELRLALARTVIASALVGAVAIWWFAPLPVQFVADRGAGGKITIRGLSHAVPGALVQVVLSISAALILIAKPLGGVSISLLLCQLQLLLLASDTVAVPAGLLELLAHQHFFSTGHQMALPFIQWDVAFLVARDVIYPWSPLVVAANAFSAFLVVALFAPAFATAAFSSAASASASARSVAGNGQRGWDRSLYSLQLYTTALLATSAAMCTHFRRHLMVWKIFAPRFMCAAVAVLATDAAALLAVVLVARASGKLAFLRRVLR